MQDYSPSPKLLRDRIILVTGAGAGIGRTAALTFARHGATVVLLGRKIAALEQVYDEITSKSLPLPAIVGLDLETPDLAAYEHVAATIEEEFGRLDGLLHNAAILGTLTPMELYNLETWGRVLQVNVQAPYLLTRACLPLLRKSPDASVIFTSADVGRRGRAYWGAYAVACFATEGMMQVFATELEQNTSIRVNSLDPGPVRTAMRARAYPGEDGATLASPESIMASYLYLIGPDSQGVTGQARSAQEDVEQPGS